MNLILVTGLAVIGVCVCLPPTLPPTGHHSHRTTHAHHTVSHHAHHTVSHHGHHTHATKVPHEPVEHENFLFYYIHHKMYIRSGVKCYIADLTADEQTKVHTDTGIREIEVKLIQMMSIATNVTGHINPNSTRICGGHHPAKQFYTIP